MVPSCSKTGAIVGVSEGCKVSSIGEAGVEIGCGVSVAVGVNWGVMFGVADNSTTGKNSVAAAGGGTAQAVRKIIHKMMERIVLIFLF